jgi:arylsulfatase
MYLLLTLPVCALGQDTSSSAAAAAEGSKPNIILVFMDNFGWGEPGFNGGGVVRGAPTPRLDALANEGLRLTNFNVEAQCTPSRSAIMTGRYAIRSGNGTIPLGGGVYGLVFTPTASRTCGNLRYDLWIIRAHPGGLLNARTRF